MRFWEVDFTRGIAIILMIIFNWSYALRFFDIFTVQTGWLYWYLFPRFIASIFLFIVGISLVLSYNHIGNVNFIYKKNIKRGLIIFGLGMLITAVTWLLFPQNFIFFGILHLIGLSIIFATPFLKLKKLNLFLGTAIISAGLVLGTFTFNFPWLSWLGFVPTNLNAFDYFPIFPWFGIVLLGIYFGEIHYRRNKRTFKLPDFSNTAFVKGVNFLGKNSLIVYLLHQPILLLILFILGYPLFL